MKHQIARNAKCPCGSGSKYKNCCAKNAERVDGNDVLETRKSDFGLRYPPSGVRIDHAKKTIGYLPVAEDDLRVHLDNVVQSRVRLFDELYKDEFEEISKELYSINEILDRCIEKVSIKDDEHSKPLLASVMGILHLTQMIRASADLLRRGYRYEIGLLIRHALEISAVLLCMSTDEEMRQAILDEKNLAKASTAYITQAKRIFPIYGQLYGLLSDNFAHFNYRIFDGATINQSEDSEATEASMRILKSGIILTRLCTEFHFFSICPEHRLIEQVGDSKPLQIRFKENAFEWMYQFMNFTPTPD